MPDKVEGALILPVSSLDITTEPVPAGVIKIFSFDLVPNISLSSYVIAPVFNDVVDIPDIELSTYAFTDCCDGT